MFIISVFFPCNRVSCLVSIGGPASASVVAVSFHLGLASLGIILGVLSNVIGNYANLITGALFQWVSF
jgi:uncharacterized membrane protein